MRFISLLCIALALAVAADSVAQGAHARENAGDVRLSKAQRAALGAMLERPENRGMEVRLARQAGVPAFLVRGEKPLAVARTRMEERKEAIRFLAHNASLFLMENPAEELELSAVHADARGGNHYRFQQQRDGVRIHGASAIAHFNDAGEMYAFTTHIVQMPAIDVHPALAHDAARAIAREPFANADITQDATLEVRNIGGEWRLVYTVSTMVNQLNRWTTIIDAMSGAVLMHAQDHRETAVSASGRDLSGTVRGFTAWKENGVHYLIDVTAPRRTSREDPLPGPNAWGDVHVVDVLNSEGDTQVNIDSRSAHTGWDAAGVSAMANSMIAYRYFRDVHGRASFDDRNGSVLSAVHYGVDYDNAFWNGTWMVFGDGGRRYSSLAGCTDMVAHEFTHGVIDHSANLAYENQSGALNESLADVFGVLAANDGNWTLGEGCVKVAPGYMRSLANPHAGRRWQPAHMSEYVHLPNTEDGDHGGVHRNSGIPNRAAYLLAEGLSAEGLGTSIGREKAGALYYHALTNYLLPGAEFIDLRRAMLLAAVYLYPHGSAERDAVAAAFDAVGIVEERNLAAESATEGAVTPSATRLDFGDIAPGESHSLALDIVNATPEYVAVHAFMLDNAAFSHDFSNTVIAPGETLRGHVAFTGDAAGTQSGRLEIETDGASISVDLIAVVKPAPPAPPLQSASGGGALHPFMLLALALAYRKKMRGH